MLNVFTASVMLFSPSAMVWDKDQEDGMIRVRGRTKPMAGKLITFKLEIWVLRVRMTMINELIAVTTWSEVWATDPTTPRRATKIAVSKMLTNFIVVKW